MEPHTDIVICVRGTRPFPIEEDFIKCVESVVAHTRSYRFIFVDDNSDDVGAEVVARTAAKFPTAILLRTHIQNWFTRAHNKGLRLVRTHHAVTLNADTFVGPHWLEELYECGYEAEQQNLKPVGLVGSVYSAEETRRWICSDVQARSYVTGHCWLLSMNAIAQAAAQRNMPGWYLDETNPMNAHIRSDIEMCWRLNALGWQTVQSHKSYVMHIGGRSWGHQLMQIQCMTQEQLDRIGG